MGLIELHVPQAIVTLVGDERDRLLRVALRVAAKQRVRELKKERREAVSHIRRLERKYGATLVEFERKQLGALNTAQAHEDYNEWFFWASVLARADKAQDALAQMETVP